MPDISNPQKEKVIVVCSSCNTQYNVTKLQPGAKFRCAKCGMINSVPASTGQPAIQAVRKNVPAPQASKIAIRNPPGVGRKSSLPRGRYQQTETEQSDLESSEQRPNIYRQRKKNSTPMIIGLVAGGFALIIALVYLFSSGGETPQGVVGENSAGSKTDKTMKSEEKKSENPISDTSAILLAPEPAKKELKTTPKKPKLEIDEALKTEILPLLKALPTQSGEEFNKTKQTIISKGNKAIPILIKEIINPDKQVARYASEILIAMTGWPEAPNVNPMVGSETLKDFEKDWEDWWNKEGKIKFPF